MIVATKSARDPKLRWFAQARFGMFVHFGLYALLGRGEWVMYNEGIPREEYEKLARRFNPHRFDADAWVDTARRAGARYITVTAKHHDGFCLFDSALTDYKITNTPFGRDLIGELIAACRRADMRICLYYSQPDWRHPNFVHHPGAFKDLSSPPPDQRPDWDAYTDYYLGQVRELCSNYGRVDGIWFDGSHKSIEEWRGREVYRMIKRLQPGAVVNDRARCGDFFTPERRLPDDLAGYLFEACQSISEEAWGWRADSTLYSAPYLVASLARMAGHGGNYLLNVGPRPDGTLPDDWVERLLCVGRWLETYGEAVYATGAFPVDCAGETVYATQRGRHVYLLLPSWPQSDRLRLGGLRVAPQRAELLGGGRLGATMKDGALLVRDLPATPPEATVNVIRLTFAVAPRPQAPRREPAPVVAVAAKGATVLAANDARAVGRGPKGALVRNEGGVLCGWMAPEQQAIWQVNCEQAGDYEVALELRCAAAIAGCEYEVGAGREHITATVRATPSAAFRRQRAGVLHLPAGRTRLTLHPTRLTWGYRFADVRAVRLRRR